MDDHVRGLIKEELRRKFGGRKFGTLPFIATTDVFAGRTYHPGLAITATPATLKQIGEYVMMAYDGYNGFKIMISKPRKAIAGLKEIYIY